MAKFNVVADTVAVPVATVAWWAAIISYCVVGTVCQCKCNAFAWRNRPCCTSVKLLDHLKHFVYMAALAVCSLSMCFCLLVT